MKAKIGYLFLFIAAMLFLLTGSGVSGEEMVRFSNTLLHQGDFFQVKVNAPKNSIVQIKFLDEAQRLQSADDGSFMGLVAVSYYTVPGDHPFIVEIKDENEVSANSSVEYISQIKILKRIFPESRIKVPEKTRKEILSTEHEDSDAKTTNEVRDNAQINAVPPLWNGTFVWPVKGKLTTDFGFIRYVNDIEEGRHSGLDIAAPAGTQVLAANNGRVIFAGSLYLTGLTVILHHGMNLYSSYGHFSKIKVQEGAFVSKGDVIGLVGATGLATGPHVHLTFRVGDIPVNPYLFLNKELKWEF